MKKTPVKHSRVLVSCIGNADLKAAMVVAQPNDQLGPIRTILKSPQEVGQIDAVVLLNTGIDDKALVVRSIKRMKGIRCESISTEINDPTNIRQINDAFTKSLNHVVKTFGESADILINTTSGTPIMSATWIILAKTAFKARLLQTSRPGQGVRVREIILPFSLAAGALDINDTGEEQICLSCHPSRMAYATAEKIAPTDEPVLVLGETGTGKELFAKHIHRESRRAGPFVVVNCASIPDSLFESHFFGHAKGAFTGAEYAHKGFFEQAHNGTLFLDEIGEMPLEQQAKLLRVLQEGRVRPVGDKSEIEINVRIISATNRDLWTEIGSDTFRLDLYYRIAVFTLRLPSLREYGSGLLEVIYYYLNRVENKYRQDWTLDDPAVRKLLEHDWPGNFRELWMTMLRLCVLADGSSITEQDVALHLEPQCQASTLGLDLLEKPLGNGFDIGDLIEEVKKHYLSRAYKESHGRVEKAAQLLGLKQPTFSTWRKKLGLQDDK